MFTYGAQQDSILIDGQIVTSNDNYKYLRKIIDQKEGTEMKILAVVEILT